MTGGVVIEVIEFIRGIFTALEEFLLGLDPWIAFAVLITIVFVETGLLIGFFLPGDSLLFTAGLVGALAGWNVPLLIVLLITAAILGDSLNYYLGRQVGPRIFYRDDSLFLSKKHLFRAQAFYDKHGGKTIVIARFVPIIRTFAPFVAGIGHMDYRRFLSFNVLGGIFWVSSMVTLGYFLGQVEFIKKNFEFAVFAIVGFSLIPVAWEYWRRRVHRKEEATVVVPESQAPGS